MAGNLYCVSYSDRRMTRAQQLLEESFMSVPLRCRLRKWTKGYGLNDISGFFWDFNENILSQERGAGYWLWKPYIIYDAFKCMVEGDYLLYCDAGLEIINDVSCLIETGKDMVFFCNLWAHVLFCKKQVMKTMLGDWNGSLSNYPQTQASSMLIKKTPSTCEFIREWLSWCQIPGFIDDTPMGKEDPDFRDHRHDQAILTNLCITHNIDRYWWQNQHDGHPRQDQRDWPVLFNHHRKRNEEW